MLSDQPAVALPSCIRLRYRFRLSTHTPQSFNFYPSYHLRTLSLSVWAFWGTCAFAVDIDSDGLSDIWQQKFGAQDLLATADDDGDGYTNEEEATAATDPFDSSDYPKQRGMTAGPGGNPKILEFPTKVGKWYQLSESRDLQNFVSVGPLLSGTGQMMHLQVDSQNASKRAAQINHELWANVAGTELSGLTGLATFPTNPDGLSTLDQFKVPKSCLLYTSPSPRDLH